jgi:D-alanyl-D-alanine dipeptidase
MVVISHLFSCQQNENIPFYTKDIIPKIEREAFNSFTFLDDSLFALQMKGIALENRLRRAGLVNLLEIDSSIHVDVKYSSTDNFVGIDLYGYFDAIYLQPPIAERLKLAQSSLKEVDSNLSLLVYDGTRPRSVQRAMWNALDTVPFIERIKFVSNPKNGSIHNYGCAVDLTIVNTKTSEVLDMGAGFDDPRPIAYPNMEAIFLETGELTQEQYRNRRLLRKVMGKGGFWVLPTEWWHFNGLSRKAAKEKYAPIE